MLVTNKIESYTTKAQFAVKQFINCNTKNVIYAISCTACQKLKERIWRHISDVPHALSRNVSSASFHFFSVHGGYTESLKAQGIERVFPPIRGGDFKCKC